MVSEHLAVSVGCLIAVHLKVWVAVCSLCIVDTNHSRFAFSLHNSHIASCQVFAGANQAERKFPQKFSSKMKVQRSEISY